MVSTTATTTTNMARVKKRPLDLSPELPRRSTRSSRTSASTSTTPSTSTPPLDKVEMRLPMPLASNGAEIRSGPNSWDEDFKQLKSQWKKGEIDGYGGLVATITSKSTVE